MRVSKWGNSLAIHLPAMVVEALRLKEGDEIEFHIAGTREFGVARKPSQQDFLNRLRTYRGRLPAEFKFDREKAIADRQSVPRERPMTRLIDVRRNCIKRP